MPEDMRDAAGGTQAVFRARRRLAGLRTASLSGARVK
jgi:hypothetical protein